MTFADKKIEELEKEIIDCIFEAIEFDNTIREILSPEQKNEIAEKALEYLNESNFFKQTIAEAEREGMRKAYNFIIDENEFAKETNEKCLKDMQLKEGETFLETKQRIRCFANQVYLCQQKLKELNSEQSPELVEGR